MRQPLHDDLGHLLRRANQRSQVQSRKILRPFQITPIQYSAMRAMNELGPAIQRHLALHLGLEASNLHEILKRLEKKGLISKSRDAVTNRSDFVIMTNKGRKLFEKVDPLLIQNSQELLDILPERDKKVFLSCMSKLAGIN